MRCLPIAIVFAFVAPARADTGFYFAETFTAASFQGDLDAYAKGGLRFTFGVNIRQLAWTTEVLGGCILDEAIQPEARLGAYCFAGFDLRRTWDVLRPRRTSHAGVRLSLEAGPRYFVGTAALYGYSGPGASASARLEGDVWVIGYFLIAGIDAMWLHMPVDDALGVVPFAGLGGKVGWL